jgi:hypothetical protein
VLVLVPVLVISGPILTPSLLSKFDALAVSCGQ